ncbi:MAG: glycerate kinase [Anaerolineae bacterium]|nr:glycerate kinase [Anaerolineae bacterium]
MRIALAPNAFRGSLTALQAIECLATGLRASALRPHLDLVRMPLADGGDGTLDVLLHGLSGTRHSVTVSNARGAPITAEFGILSDGKTAIIELARASGIELLPRAERNPLLTTTYGTGELIREAYRRGCRHFLIGIGGSATNDGGAGCLQALGARFLDANGRELPQGGGALRQLAHVDVSALRANLPDAKFTILCDVTSPLIGAQGASRTFAPQKGADPEMVEQLEAALTHYAEVLARDLGVDVAALQGGGAAGGFGAGMAAALGAELVLGAPTVMSLLNYEAKLEGVQLLITGEGKIDSQTESGKAVQRIAAAAAARHIPVIAFAGTIEATPSVLAEMGITAAWSILPAVTTLSEALANAPLWLTRAAHMLGNTLAIMR